MSRHIFLNATACQKLTEYLPSISKHHILMSSRQRSKKSEDAGKLTRGFNKDLSQAAQYFQERFPNIELPELRRIGKQVAKELNIIIPREHLRQPNAVFVWFDKHWDEAREVLHRVTAVEVDPDPAETAKRAA
jgi:hypothetical protein